MERPERPSRHSKTHDKWKRIIEPAGDSDSSSDWSTDATCQENDIMSTRTYFDGPSGGDGAGPSTSTTAPSTADKIMSRVRIRSLLPPHDFSSLLARYGSERVKRAASEHDDRGEPPGYHLLHHDYAERDAFRDLQSSYGVGRTSSANNDNYSFFMRSGGSERKRSRSHRHLPSLEDPLAARPARPDEEDSDRELYVIRLPSPVPPGPADGASDLHVPQMSDEASHTCRQMKLKHGRRSYPRSFFGDLPPLSERSAAAVAAARMDQEPLAVAGGSADVQVISMALAGPVPSAGGVALAALAPPRIPERPADEEIIIVEDTQSTAGATILAATVVVPLPLTISSPASAASSGSGGSEEESLNQHLISLLECPVCTEYMSPPIHQCRRGHLLCAACKPKLPQCPTCRSRFTDSRNLAMEQVADRLLYPCKNRELESSGCGAQLRLKDKSEHEANCAFRSFHCTLPTCDWKGLKDALFLHSIEQHRDVLLIGSKQELRVNMLDLNSTVNRNWLVSAFDELFRINFVSPKGAAPALGTPPSRQHVLGCVQFIGPRNGADRFKYTIETRRDRANRCLRYSRNVHSDLSRCTGIYSAVDCFHMRGETAELVCERKDGALLLPVVVTLSLNATPTPPPASPEPTPANV